MLLPVLRRARSSGCDPLSAHIITGAFTEANIGAALGRILLHVVAFAIVEPKIMKGADNTNRFLGGRSAIARPGGWTAHYIHQRLNVCTTIWGSMGEVRDNKVHEQVGVSVQAEGT